MEQILAESRLRAAYRELYEYQLVVKPGPDVYNKVMEEKQFFNEYYRQPVAVKTRPHITLANFMATEDMEDTLIRWLQRIAKEQVSFTVLLNNYSGFPSHSIFIRVQDPVPFKQLSTRLKVIGPYIKEYSSLPAKFVTFPYVSLASRLPLKVYDQAIKDYAGKDFTASFQVTELSMLRRQPHNEVSNEISVFHLHPGV